MRISTGKNLKSYRENIGQRKFSWYAAGLVIGGSHTLFFFLILFLRFYEHITYYIDSPQVQGPTEIWSVLKADSRNAPSGHVFR